MLILIPFASKAYVTKSDDFIYIAKDEIVEGNFYFSGKSLTVEGQIMGDLIGIAPNIQINGKVNGDVIGASQNLFINGEVGGNLRFFSSTANINGIIEKNINFFGETIILGENSVVGSDLLMQTINSELNGKVNGNVHGGTYNILINGEIEKNINLTLDNQKRKIYSTSMEIGEAAVISGNINYKAGENATIKSKNIKGEINHKYPEKIKDRANKTTKLLYLILSSFLMALLLSYLFKDKVEKIKKVIIEKNNRLALPGLILLLLTPIAILIASLTIIGIPIALLALAIWIFILFLSRIILAMILGDYIFKIVKKEKIPQILKILSGIIFAFLLFALPYVGWIFSLTAVVLGFGSIYFIIKSKKHDN